MPCRADSVPPDTSQNHTTYDTDLTDPKWALIEPLLPPPDTSGTPRTTNLRHAVNAMRHRLKTGCQWKMLPNDFGIPWRTVYNCHEQFAWRGVWERVQRVLAEQVRVADGRDPGRPCWSSIRRRSRRPNPLGRLGTTAVRRRPG